MIDCVFSLWSESGSLPLPRLFAGYASDADSAAQNRRANRPCCASRDSCSGLFIEPNQGESPQKFHLRRLWSLYEQTFPEALDGPEPPMPPGKSSMPRWPYAYGITKSGVAHSGRSGHRKEPRPLDMQYESIGSFYARRIPPLNHAHPLTAWEEPQEQESESEAEEGEKQQGKEGEEEQQREDSSGGGNNDDREGNGGHEGERDGSAGEDGREGGGGEKGNRDEPSDMDEDVTESEDQEGDIEDDPEDDLPESLVKNERGEPDPETDEEQRSSSYVHETDNDTIVVKFEPPSVDSDMQINEDDMTQEMLDDLPDLPDETEQRADLVDPPAKLPCELRPDEPIEPMGQDEVTILEPSAIQTAPRSSCVPMQHRRPRLRRPKSKQQPRPFLVTSPLAERQALLRRRPLLQPRPQTMPPILPQALPATPHTASETALQARPPPLLRINSQVSHDPDDPGSARTPAVMDAFWESALQRLHQQKQRQLLQQTGPPLPRPTLRSLQPRPTQSPTSVTTSVLQQPLPPPPPHSAPGSASKTTIAPPAYLVSSPDGTLMNAYEYRQQARTQAIEAARDRMRRLQSGEPLLTSRRGAPSGSNDTSHVTTGAAEGSNGELMVVDQAELTPESAALSLPGTYRGRPCPCCNKYIRRDRSILPEEDYGREEKKDYIPISLLYDMLPRPPKGYPFFDS